MNDLVIPKGRVTLYACGGAAINIISKLGNVSINPDILANTEVTLIDTSKSNLTGKLLHASCYLVEGVDGSGKIRAENSAVIGERIKEMLQRHQPGDLSIVMHSGAGGSGSVIGPLLISELAVRGLPAIVLMVGSTASVKETENTLKTLKSYEAIAQKRQVPVVMSYLQNSSTLPRGDVDKQMISTVTYLAMLYSRRNRELDTKDLHNWLRYAAPVTSFEPHLSVLTVLWHEQNDPQLKADLSKLGNIITVATLTPEGLATDLPLTPEYQAVGILPDLKDSSSQLAGKLMNYVISDGLVAQFTKGLNDFLKAQEELVASRPKVASILAVTDAAGDDGLVL